MRRVLQEGSRLISFAVLVVVAVVLPGASAQQATAAHFDVVSVKPGDPALNGQQMVQPSPGRYRATNLTFLSLVLGAYHINPNQLIGGPSWLTSAGWDIDARFPVDTPEDQRSLMMQSLLAERFGLVIHREIRTLQTYRLTVAKGGSKMAEVADPQGGSMSAGPRMIRYSSATMEQLASQLSSYLGGQVVDATGLKGRYKIDLKFVPVDPGTGESTESGPTIFTALQEQLGLKLDAAKGPVEVIVIDKAEKPQAN